MNLMTDSMEKLTRILRKTDSKLKEYGREPYGVRKATPSEQREMYENLTVPQFYELVDKHGLEAVNKWLRRFEGGAK